MVKVALKLVWFAFGAFGLFTVGQKFWPHATPANLIKGVQGVLQPDQSAAPDSSPLPFTLTNLKDLDPQQVSQVLGQMVKTEVVKILETASEQITTFPARQVKKIKIGACEDLLEQDICSVAQEINCQAE